MTLTKTPQQEAILAHVSTTGDSLNVVARAGSGKTTSLLMICEALDGSAFLGAFNKGIATELQGRLKDIENSMIEAGTFHSLGFRGWRRAYPKVVVDSDKLWKLINNLGDIRNTSGGAIRELVSVAKQRLFNGTEGTEAWSDLIDHFGIECQFRDAQVIEAAKKVFNESVEQCPKTIDFDDMLFAPLHFNVSLPQYDSMLIDEAQDTNQARRELAIRCLADGGRLIAVGDDRQAIYGFSGADAEAMNLIRSKMGSKALPLTVSWRCAQEVIRRAQQWVPDIEHAPNAKPGEVRYTTEAEVYKHIAAPDGNMDVPKAGDAVLCRNTKPLVQLAYYCIRQRVGVTIEGRDIGKRIITLVEKFKETDLTKLADRIEKYSNEEQERLIQKGKPQIAASLADLCETVLFLAESLRMEGKTNVSNLTRLLDGMFSDSGDRRGASNILLSTIHKAKGREWEKVFILGENKYQPSRYAKLEWMKTQERNLMYVSTTRAKDTLVHIGVD